MKHLRLLIFLLLVVGIALKSRAYPDLIRHNYVNCNACHVSPTGGGLMNAYGRSLSKELLSSFGKDGEEKLFHGVMPQDPPAWLLAGGDVRFIQVHQESPERKTGRAFLMQANIAVGVDAGKAKAVAVIGEANPRHNNVQMSFNRYYALWDAQEQLSLRIGRFIPVFGINVPYHTLPTRADLGFGPGLERNTLEMIWNGEIWSAGVSLSQKTNSERSFAQDDSLVTAQMSRVLGSSSKVGISLANGATIKASRQLYGVHALLGFNEDWAYLTEFVLQKKAGQNEVSTTGLFHFSQLIFEPWKGVNFYLLEDYKNANLENSEGLTNSLGLGARLFPRPHFEVDMVFQKTRVALIADRYDDFAWLVGHYYF